MRVESIAKEAKKASLTLQSLDEKVRTDALKSLAKEILSQAETILTANDLDVKNAHDNKLSSALLDRLTLSKKSLTALAEMCLSVAKQPQVIGMIETEHTRPDGLLIQKQRIPLGVIGMIFESRPNVVIDGAALAIKSGNAIILKGGKEAQHSNLALFHVIEEAIKDILPKGSVSLIETREDVDQLLKLDKYIDLMVPRGGSTLIEYVKKEATMPVVAHDKGLCHIYVHLDADVKIVLPILLNAKCQRPGVCNAVESLILHEGYPHNQELITSLLDAGVEVRGCVKSQSLNSRVKLATEEDYGTEYLDKILSLKIVENENTAFERIKKYSSHHTEAILAQDQNVITQFLNSLDASCLVVNASTRFNDGGELGLGAELGISTSKLHAYGAMGAKEMTTTRFLVKGNGQTR